MKLGDMSDGKQSKVVMIVLIVVIVAAIAFVAKSFIGGGGSGGDYVPPAGDSGVPPSPMGPPPGGGMPPSAGPPGAPPPGGPPAPPAAGPPSAGPAAPAPAPSQPPAATAPPSAAPPSQPAQPARPAPGGGAKAPGGAAATGSVTVFGSVTVSYPKGWGVKIGGSNKKAVFTDGKAYFEVNPPDPKANSAKAIAQIALKTSGKGGKIIGEAADKVSGHDAYWYAVNVGGKTMRIVGIDGPTRVAVVAYTSSSLFPKYRDTFNKMQSEIKFR